MSRRLAESALSALAGLVLLRKMRQLIGVEFPIPTIEEAHPNGFDGFGLETTDVDAETVGI
jgi:hypothetical protein